MAELNREQKEFVVRRIARFEQPKAIIIAFNAFFPDTKLDDADITRLNPSSGAILSMPLHTIYLSEREAVLVDPESAPYTNQKARLIALSNDVRFFRDNNQLGFAANVLRQIAEELGVIGPGKAKKPEGDGDEANKLVREITRTIIDPKKDPNEQAPE